MSTSRRHFMQFTVATAGLFSQGGLSPQAFASNSASRPAVAPKRILVLGGTGFLGPAVVEAARARGHILTLFNRGRTRTHLFPDLEKRIGDRDPKKGEGLKSLETGEWDAVIDDTGFYPRIVSASARLLAPRVKQYLYISSISCYQEPWPLHCDEDAPLATLQNPEVEEMGSNYENYGGLKALCEQAAEQALPGRTCVVRPGYIVGPGDGSGRFTYWPARFNQASSEVAVPGSPDDPFQVIDVRDLAEWLVLLVENQTVGKFNAVGNQQPLRWGQVIKACQNASDSKAKITWIPADFMVKFMEQNKTIEFPIWAPYLGSTKGNHTVKNARAMSAGLRFRPIETTVKDTLTWYQGQLKEENGRTKLAFSSAQEAQVLAAWRASKS